MRSRLNRRTVLSLSIALLCGATHATPPASCGADPNAHVPLRTNLVDNPAAGEAWRYQFSYLGNAEVDMRNPAVTGPQQIMPNYNPQACNYEYSNVGGVHPVPHMRDGQPAEYAAASYEASLGRAPYVTCGLFAKMDAAAGAGGLQIIEPYTWDIAGASPLGPPQSISDYINKIKVDNSHVGFIHGLTHMPNTSAGLPGSMFTLILPPGFNPNAPRHSYPIVAHSFYDLKTGLNEFGVNLAHMISASKSENGMGAIGVIWNAHGSVMSRSMDDATVTEFEWLTKFLEAKFGADPQRIMMYGGSRGAMTPLHLASSMVPHTYAIKYIYAQNPATSLGLTSTLAGGTYPYMNDAASYSVGLADAWMKNFIHPTAESGCGHPEFANLTGQQAHLKSLVNQTDPAYADANVTPIAPARIQKLVNDRTAIDLIIGTNDIIVPTPDQFAYMLALHNRNANFHGTIRYLGGHMPSERGTFADHDVLFRNFLYPRLRDLINYRPINLDGAIETSLPDVSCADGNSDVKCSYVDSASKFGPVWSSGQSPLWPVSIDVPRVYTTNSGAPLVFTGGPGRNVQFDIVETNSDGTPNAGGYTNHFSGQINASGNLIFRLDNILPTTGAAHSYKVTNIYLDNGAGTGFKYITPGHVQKTVQYDYTNIADNEFKIDWANNNYNADGHDVAAGVLSWYSPTNRNQAGNLVLTNLLNPAAPVAIAAKNTALMNSSFFFNVSYGGLLETELVYQQKASMSAKHVVAKPTVRRAPMM